MLVSEPVHKPYIFYHTGELVADGFQQCQVAVAEGMCLLPAVAKDKPEAAAIFGEDWRGDGRFDGRDARIFYRDKFRIGSDIPDMSRFFGCDDAVGDVIFEGNIKPFKIFFTKTSPCF